jgi:hypothetical protein
MKVNQRTGQLRPREIEAVGNKLRSQAELDEIEKEKEKILKKYNLIEINFDKSKGLT